MTAGMPRGRRPGFTVRAEVRRRKKAPLTRVQLFRRELRELQLAQGDRLLTFDEGASIALRLISQNTALIKNAMVKHIAAADQVYKTNCDIIDAAAAARIGELDDLDAIAIVHANAIAAKLLFEDARIAYIQCMENMEMIAKLGPSAIFSIALTEPMALWLAELLPKLMEEQQAIYDASFRDYPAIRELTRKMLCKLLVTHKKYLARQID